MSELVSQRKFAEIIGVTPQAVTKMVRSGRITLTAEGKVDVDQAKRQLAASRDPADQIRKETTAAAGVRAVPVGGGAAAAPAMAPAAPPAETSAYQQSRSVREMYAARTAKLEYEQKAGLLVRKDEVEAVWSKFASVMRTAMRAIPRRMAPLLEGQEIGMIELRLQEAIDAELTALSKNPLGEPMQE